MKTIIIDPGHGGKDSGATGHGLKEKDIVLEVANIIVKKLKTYNLNVITTRDTDKFISLGERTTISNSNNADLFVSIHCNSASNKNANGVETFYYHDNSLATVIQDRLWNTGLYKSNRGVKKGNFHVIRENKALSCLVELGFINNYEESKMMARNVEILASAIVDGILESLGMEVYDVKKIKINLNGKIKEVDAINVDGNNFIKLQDIRDDKIAIGYDKMPIVRVDNK